MTDRDTSPYFETWDWGSSAPIDEICEYAGNAVLQKLLDENADCWVELDKDGNPEGVEVSFGPFVIRVKLNRLVDDAGVYYQSKAKPTLSEWHSLDDAPNRKD